MIFSIKKLIHVLDCSSENLKLPFNELRCKFCNIHNYKALLFDINKQTKGSN